MRVVRVILLVAFLSTIASVTTLADGYSNENSSSHTQYTNDSSQADRPALDNKLTKETVNLGTKLFFPITGLGNFKTRYTTETFGTGQNLAEALNAKNERAIALAAYDMMRPLNNQSWSSGYDQLEKLSNKFDDKPSSDSQFENFAKRLMVAFNNWGENKDTGKPQDAGKPSDPKLQAFYEAFKEVKAEKAKEQEKLKRLVKSAGGKNGDGNDADKRRLYSDPKLGVGPNALSWLSQLAKSGDKESVKAWVNALGHSKGDSIVLSGNYEGRAFNLYIKKGDEQNLLASLDNAHIRNASFVGYEHPDTANAYNWEWRNGRMSVKHLNEPQVVYYGGTGSARSTAIGGSR